MNDSMVAIQVIKPSNEVYYSSIVLIVFIYFTAIFTFIELRQFIEIFDFNENFFKCRQPILNIIYIISFLFVLYILNPVTLFLSNIYGMSSSIPLLVNDIADILIFLVFFPRAWILWYDRAFVDNIKNWLWRREINPKHENFVVKYRAIMKSSHLLVYSIYLLLVSPLFVCLHILPYYNVIPFICHIIRAGLLMLLLCITFYSAKTISVVSDEWNIRSEVLSSIKTTGVFYIIANGIYVIFEHYINQQWALLIELLFVSIAHLFVIYYTCHWARKKFIFLQKIRFMRSLKAKNGRRSSYSSFLNKRIEFKHIMNHRNGIEAFCNHLSDEFGLESMLFLIEVTQFKAITRKISNGRFLDNIPDLADLHEIAHIFCAETILNIHWLPINHRMYSLTPYQIALYLYDKYIEESADLCINISFGIRKDIYRYFQELSLSQENNQNDASIIHRNNNNERDDGFDEFEMNQLNETNILLKIYKVYDEAFTEIWRLIQTDSFLRFKSTEEFRRLISILFPQEAILANNHLIKMIDDEIKNKNPIKLQIKLQTEKKQIISSLSPLSPSSSLPQLKQNNNSSTHKHHGVVMEIHNDFTTVLTPKLQLQYEQHSLPSLTPNVLSLNRNSYSLPTVGERDIHTVTRLNNLYSNSKTITKTDINTTCYMDD